MPSAVPASSSTGKEHEHPPGGDEYTAQYTTEGTAIPHGLSALPLRDVFTLCGKRISSRVAIGVL
jgi:hypothetical protein